MGASGGLEPHVFAAVLAAAAMHAGWNAFLKIRLEPLLAMTVLAASAGLIALPLLVYVGWPRAEAWPWLIASAALHLGYYFSLIEAYRRADMSQIYPIARGGAPLLTAGVSAALLGEPIGVRPGLGIGLLVLGVALMSLRGGRGAAFNREGVAFGLLTAVLICGYTLVDGAGARIARDPHAFAAALFVIDGAAMPLAALWLRGASGLAPALKHWGHGFVGGALSLAAYWLVIWAMTVASIPLVAALRETSVLFAAVIAVLVLKEPLTQARVVSAGLIVAGIGLIRLG